MLYDVLSVWEVAHRRHGFDPNPDVEFRISGIAEPLKEGEAWEINNRHISQVENRSPIPRINLIIDWAIPGERCCCGQKAHPNGVCSLEIFQVADCISTPCDCFS